MIACFVDIDTSNVDENSRFSAFIQMCCCAALEVVPSDTSNRINLDLSVHSQASNHLSVLLAVYDGLSRKKTATVCRARG